VEVHPDYATGLADIDGFERIWLISWLDRSGPPNLTVIPYLDDTPRGLFSTRAPSRPNPIGISPVRLLGRTNNVLHVADLDLLDGTPILDIKPYAKWDVFPIEREGWVTPAGESETRRADARFAPPG
jgi:tRNA-Thr(GGU) m(6)t(6)A37 methyltransferase TsaA